MNTKQNQRYQITEEKIKKALLDTVKTKPLKNISVQDICKNAEINRSSFYLHYQSVYELMAAMCKQISNGISAAYHGTGVNKMNFLSEEYFAIMIRFINENKEFYRVFWGDFGMAGLELEFSFLYENMFIPYFKRQGLKDEAEMHYCFLYFKSGFVEIIREWLENGGRETPERMAEILCRSIMGRKW